MTAIDLTGKRVAVLGFGVEGDSTIQYLLKHRAKVRVFDDKPRSDFDKNLLASLERQGVSFSFQSTETLTDVDLIIRTPGAKVDHPLLTQAQTQKIPVTSATNIFLEQCPARVIGITGTKGKGTTAALIHEMLKAAGKKSWLGGNIGTPMLSFLDEVKSGDIVVLELSSFQLIDATHSPQIAVVLMVTSEHLDYHADEAEYVTAKTTITKFQAPQDVVVVNQDYKRSLEIASHSSGQKLFVSTLGSITDDGCFVDGDTIKLSREEKILEVLPTKEVWLPGRHNLENVCAAVAVGSLLDIPLEAIQTTLRTFQGLPHRLELVAEVNGVAYYNDSFATTPESTIAAVQAFDRPIVLVLGGSGKSSDFSQLAHVISSHTNLRAIIGIGEEWPRMKAAIALPRQTKLIEELTTMPEIIRTAHELAQPGDLVLLSPACASFGLFKNYKDRGEQFRNAVHALTS